MGVEGTGKSSMVIRAVIDKYVEDIDPTLEDLYRWVLRMEDGEEVAVELLDTCSFENSGCYPIMRDPELREQQAYIYVVDEHNLSSAKLKKLTQQHHRDFLTGMCRLKDLDPSAYLLPVVYVLSKADVSNVTEVDLRTELELDSSRLHTEVTFCSAKTGENVLKVFQLAVLLARGKGLLRRQMKELCLEVVLLMSWILKRRFGIPKEIHPMILAPVWETRTLESVWAGPINRRGQKKCCVQ
jgi:GTPase KRas protein